MTVNTRAVRRLSREYRDYLKWRSEMEKYESDYERKAINVGDRTARGHWYEYRLSTVDKPHSKNSTVCELMLFDFDGWEVMTMYQQPLSEEMRLWTFVMRRRLPLLYSLWSILSMKCAQTYNLLKRGESPLGIWHPTFLWPEGEKE